MWSRIRVYLIIFAFCYSATLSTPVRAAQFCEQLNQVLKEIPNNFSRFKGVQIVGARGIDMWASSLLILGGDCFVKYYLDEGEPGFQCDYEVSYSKIFKFNSALNSCLGSSWKYETWQEEQYTDQGKAKFDEFRYSKTINGRTIRINLIYCADCTRPGLILGVAPELY